MKVTVTRKINTGNGFIEPGTYDFPKEQAEKYIRIGKAVKAVKAKEEKAPTKTKERKTPK